VDFIQIKYQEYIKLCYAKKQCTYQSNTEALSRNHCRRGKTIIAKYSECVSVSLLMQHAKRIRHILLSPVTYLAVQYFPTLSPKGHDFRGNFIEGKICFDVLYSFCLKIKLYTLRIIQGEIIIILHRSSCKVPVILFRYDKTWIFGTYLRKLRNYQI
jgi:hypothetical protein